jgi:hypothetical protein
MLLLTPAAATCCKVQACKVVLENCCALGIVCGKQCFCPRCHAVKTVVLLIFDWTVICAERWNMVMGLWGPKGGTACVPCTGLRKTFTARCLSALLVSCVASQWL